MAQIRRLALLNNDQNFLWWVIPGFLAGMPMPFVHTDRRMNHGGLLTAYEDDLPLLHKAGVRAVVSLLNLPTDAPVYESAGFAFLCLPVPDGEALTTNQADELVRFITFQRTKQQPVAIHCEAGLGRTGTALAAYLISQGETAETAIRQIRGIEKAAIETKRQIKFLEEYPERCKISRMSTR